MPSRSVEAAGAVLITLGWLSFLVFGSWVLWTWRNHWSDIFPDRKHTVSRFISDRSRVLYLIYAASVVYASTIQRTFHVTEWVLQGKITTRRTEVVITGFLLFLWSFMYLLQSWRMFLHHRYYVIIANLDWTQLLDPSVESRSSFWLRYRSFLQSESTMAVCILIWTLFWGLFNYLVWDEFVLSRVIAFLLFVTIHSTAILLVWFIPETPTFQRREILIITGFVVVISLTVVAVSATVNSMVTGVIINQSLSVIFNCWQAYISFIYTPQLSFKLDFEMRMMEAAQHAAKRSPSNGVQHLEEQVHSILSDVSKLARFMKICTDSWAAENLLCLLEIREFKRKVRKSLRARENGQSAFPRLDLRLSNQNSSNGKSGHESKPSESNSMLYLDEQFEENDRWLHETTLNDKYSEVRSQLFDEKFTAWDLKCTVNLKDLGCKSGIVSDRSKDFREKATLLAKKYFEPNSEYCVNISSHSRDGILRLVGEKSDHSGDLDLLLLLFLFDEAAKDLFDNLFDLLDQFNANHH